MPAETEGSNRDFRNFLRHAPTLEDAAAGKTTELTGLVSRISDDRFAITTGDGKTYELEVQAVTRFRASEGPGLAAMVTIEIAAEALANATLRPIKPIIKDLHKDPIKDLVSDGTLYAKDLFTDPVADKQFPHDTLAAKDVQTDPVADKHIIKDVRKDPIKDFAKDPIQDPVNKGWTDPVGTGAADTMGIPDPTGGVVNPFAAQLGAAQLGAAQLGAAQQTGFTPFVMATPHHAPAHLLALQAGAPQAQFAGGAQPQAFKFVYDTYKEIAIAETIKEPIRDTYKELIRDTYKELVFETYFEGGPIGDPGPLTTQPGFGVAGFM